MSKVLPQTPAYLVSEYFRVAHMMLEIRGKENTVMVR